MLCYAVRCRVVSYRIVLCCIVAVLYCVVSCCVVLCHTVLCCVILCYIVSWCAVLCCAVLRYVVLCCVVFFCRNGHENKVQINICTHSATTLSPLGVLNSQSGLDSPNLKKTEKRSSTGWPGRLEPWAYVCPLHPGSGGQWSSDLKALRHHLENLNSDTQPQPRV